MGAVLAAAGWLAGAPLHGQEPDYQPIDRIAAIVGRNPIPESRIEERLQLMRRDPQFPTDSATIDGLRHSILDSLIVEELVVQAAERDTMVQVSEEDVQSQADERLRSIREGFVSELDFQQTIRETGFATTDEYRLWLGRDIRRKMLRTQLFGLRRQMGEIRDIQPTEAELREVYERAVAQQREQQPRPPTVSFRQIVVRPVPDSSALVAAFALADSVMRRARAGEDFGALAAEFSDDPGSAQRGGEVGWFRRGVGFAKEFERIAFALRPGQISVPVRTSFGFHIIQVQRVEPAEVQARHVLIAPEISEANRVEARARADSVAQILRDGATLESILRRYHDPDEQSYAERVVIANLPPSYQEAIEGAEMGDVRGPIPLPGRGIEKYAVILFQERLGEGEYTFEELRDRLRSSLAAQNGITRFVETLRRATFIDIRY